MYCPDCGLANEPSSTFCTGCGGALRDMVMGTVLSGRYRVEEKLGSGGMGVVYRAFDSRLSCSCALKILTAHASTPQARADLVARFQQEAQLLRRLSHPSLPRVYDYFEEGGRHILVQDFIDGDNLETLLASEGRPGLTEERVRSIALDVLEVLDYLHGQTPPIIHRDVKPGNLMVQKGTGRIVLVDFGIARDAIRTTGTAIGTLEYCAPEQWTGRAGTKSDLYSLGATMHHLLTGQVPAPFQVTTLSVQVAHIDSTLMQVVSRAVSLNPADRHPAARDMKFALMGVAPALALQPSDIFSDILRQSQPSVPPLAVLATKVVQSPKHASPAPNVLSGYPAPSHSALTPIVMGRFVVGLTIVVVLAYLAVSNNHGTKVKFGDCGVLYKEGATEADARAVGDYLVKIGIFGEQTADVQLTRKDNKFQLRFLVKAGVDKDEPTMDMLGLIGARVKAFALNNQPLQVDILGEKFDFIKTLPDLNLGQAVPVGKEGGVFFTDPSLEPQAKKLADWINGKVKDGNLNLCKLEKKGDGYEVAMVVDNGEEKKPEAEQTYGSVGQSFKEVLNAPVTLKLVSRSFKTLKTMPPQKNEQPPAGKAAEESTTPPGSEK